MQQFDLLKNLSIPKELADKLEDMNIRIVPSQLQQKKTKKMKKPKSTQAFAIEVQKESRDALLDLINQYMSQENTIFLPAKLRYNNVQA